MEGSFHGSVTLRVLFRAVVTGVRMPRLNFSGQAQYV